MRAAIYARYSSENQRPESIEDQISACRRLAAERKFSNWRITYTPTRLSLEHGRTAEGLRPYWPRPKAGALMSCWLTTSRASRVTTT